MNTEKPEKKAGVRFYILSLLIAASGFLATTLVQLLLLQTGAMKFTAETIQARHLLLVISLQGLVFILICAWFIKRFRLRLAAMTSELSIKSLLFSILGLGGVYLLTGLILKGFGIEVKQFEELNKENLRLSPGIFMATVALVAPVYEEIVFRGVILQNLLPQSWERGGWGGVVLPVIFSSALFAMMHLESGATALLPVFILSIYLSFLALYYRNVTYAVLIHSMHNALAGSMFLYAEKIIAP